MLKIHHVLTVPNLTTFGVAISLWILSLLGTALAQSSDTYGSTPLYQSPTVQSLGTLSSRDTGAAQSPRGMSPAVPSENGSDTEVLQPIQAGGLIYVTGGIGDEERNYLHNVSNDYNLHVSSASQDGAYVGDTHIVIRNHKGDVLLDTNAGPIFLAKLSKGSYTVEATHGGELKKKTVGIDNKPSMVHFSW